MKRRQCDVKSTVRCAIYTRKSTEEGLDQDFNSLDAQRESGEAFIKSQLHEGWVCLPDQYNDGGFTGGNMDRPALQRLLADIEAGKVNCVVVYKVDRLSRSLLDFARMMEVFERYGVSFVSVTQQFNTATSMGRLVLNVLLSFAQFEREMISERTRDKIAATRRKGRWTGGPPILGYDVLDKKLIVDEAEAKQVREIFGVYLERSSLLDTVRELERRGWVTKSYTTKKGTRRGGLPITKTRLHHLLTNVTYVGKIAYKAEVHEGEHPGIVEPDVFELVQETLSTNGAAGSADKRNKHGALLRGILRCASCNCGMTHTFTVKGNRRYRYYVCNNAQQHGRAACPAPSVAAGEIEQFVVEEIKAIGRDPTLVAATLAESRRLAAKAIQCLKRERAAIERQRRADEAQLGRQTATSTSNREPDRRAEIQERIDMAECRFAAIDAELKIRIGEELSEDQVAAALAEFDAVWGVLKSNEQVAILNLLIERVRYDGAAENIEISFRSSGLKTLAIPVADHEETAA